MLHFDELYHETKRIEGFGDRPSNNQTNKRDGGISTSLKKYYGVSCRYRLCQQAPRFMTLTPDLTLTPHEMLQINCKQNKIKQNKTIHNKNNRLNAIFRDFWSRSRQNHFFRYHIFSDFLIKEMRQWYHQLLNINDL
jgi:hypothetical protein